MAMGAVARHPEGLHSGDAQREEAGREREGNHPLHLAPHDTPKVRRGNYYFHFTNRGPEMTGSDT